MLGATGSVTDTPSTFRAVQPEPSVEPLPSLAAYVLLATPLTALAVIRPPSRFTFCVSAVVIAVVSDEVIWLYAVVLPVAEVTSAGVLVSLIWLTLLESVAPPVVMAVR